jgi:hypothetical protein
VKHLSGRLEGGANGAELDVGVDNGGVGGVGLNILGLARVDGAGTTGNTWLLWVGIGGESRVEPQHRDRVVVLLAKSVYRSYVAEEDTYPEGHNKNVSASKRGSHGVELAKCLERRGVAENGLLGRAESIGDGVAGDALNGGIGVLEDHAVLDVETFDLRDRRTGANELGDNGHLLGGVQSHTGAVEVLDTHTVALLRS